MELTLPVLIFMPTQPNYSSFVLKILCCAKPEKQQSKYVKIASSERVYCA